MNLKKTQSSVTRKTLLIPIISCVTLIAASTSAWAATAIEGSDNSGPTAATLEAACTSYNYDAYIGEVGYATAGGGVVTREAVNSGYNQASEINSAYNQFEAGHGIGVGSAFVISGVADSGLTQNNTDAYDWGEDQGAGAVLYLEEDNDTMSPNEVDHYTQNTVYADVESTSDWSGTLSYNEQVWDGFVYGVQNAGVNVGVYSSPGNWSTYFGNMSVTQLEWTPHTSESTVDSGYCPSTTTPFQTFTNGPAAGASWFGGETASSNATMAWQWVSGGADYDSWDLTHFNSVFGTSYSP